jgi:release factor glutamine methyltransferase
MNPEEGVAIADLLLCAALETDMGTMLSVLDEEMSEESEEFCGKAIKELSYGKPIQYILGSCCFFGQDIFVGEGVFIPRSDTELLVETALKILQPGDLFADLCSGSGCISRAIGANLTDCKGYALELSRKALPYTIRNLDPCPNVEVLRFDVLDPDEYAALAIKAGRQFDLLVSNPPYIPTDVIDMLSTEVQYEPHTALDGGEDGLRYYRAIVAYAPLLLKPDGILLFEIGYDQAEEVSRILEDAGYSVAVLKDYSKNDRVVLAKRG